MCVCVCVRERERGRETETHKSRAEMALWNGEKSIIAASMLSAWCMYIYLLMVSDLLVASSAHTYWETERSDLSHHSGLARLLLNCSGSVAHATVSAQIGRQIGFERPVSHDGRIRANCSRGQTAEAVQLLSGGCCLIGVIKAVPPPPTTHPKKPESKTHIGLKLLFSNGEADLFCNS